MNMGRPLPLPPILPPTEKSSATSTNTPIGVTPTRTELFQSETGRAIDNLVTSSPLFYTTGSRPSFASKYQEQLGSPSILKPNFRDLTGCTRLTTSLSRPSRSYRALQSLREDRDSRKPNTMGKSSQQATYSSSRTREREKVLPPVPIRVNAKIRQIYSHITPTTTIPPPAVLSQMTQTETEYFLIPATSTISTSRTAESQIRQADQVASSSGSNINTADACTSPINAPSSRKSSAYPLPPLSFTPNYISKLEDLEKITGHIIIQRFFTRTDDAFGSWIERQLTLTNKTVGVGTGDVEDSDGSEDCTRKTLSEDDKSVIMPNESEPLEVQEEIKNDDGYIHKNICSPIEELSGEILSAEENNLIELEEIGDEHDKHDPLLCSVDDCVQCECFQNEYENYDGKVIDPRSSTPINELDAIEEDIISQCVVLELKRALEKDSQELAALAVEENNDELAETTIGSETLEKDDEIIEECVENEECVDTEDSNERKTIFSCEAVENTEESIEKLNAEEEIGNNCKDGEEADKTCKDRGENEEIAIDENIKENQGTEENISEEKDTADSEEKIKEKEDLIVGSEECIEEKEKSEQIDTEICIDEILESDVSNSKVVDYLTELGGLPTNDEEIFNGTEVEANADVEGNSSQIFAGVQLTEVEGAGESVERDGEPLVPRLKRSTSIDSCLGTESSGETRTILNDSGSSRLGDSGRFEHELVCWPSISDMVPRTPRIQSLEEIIQENCPGVVGTINIVNGAKSWEEQETQEQEITIIHSCKTEIAKSSRNENLSESSGDGPRSRDRESESDRGTETESEVNSENYHARSEAESSLLQDDDEDEVENDDFHSQEDQFESMISNHTKGRFIRGLKRNISTQTGKSIDSSRSTTASTSSSFDLEVVSKSKRFTTCTTQLSSGNSDYVVADRRRSYLPTGTSSLNLLNMKFSVGKEFESEVSICVPAKSHGTDVKSFVARKVEKSHQPHHQQISSCRDIGVSSSRQKEKVSQAELSNLWKDVKTKMDNKVGLGRSDNDRGNTGSQLQIVGNGLRVTDSLGVLTVTNSPDTLNTSEGNNDKIKRSLQRLKKILEN